MKLRICIILLLGALTLACFEIWRYRTENKNFKYLYEAKSAELSAYWSAFRAYNSTIILLQDSGLLKDKLIFADHYVDSTLRTHYSPASVSVSAMCYLDFSFTPPLQPDDLKKIDQVKNNLRELLPANWRIEFRLKEQSLHIFIGTDYKRFDEPWTRFPPIKKKA